MGLVDILVDQGSGRHAVESYIRRQNKLWNAYHALQRIQATSNRMTREELEQSAKIWVDAALKVSPTHLRVMDRLIRAQNRATTKPTTTLTCREESNLITSANT